ncbi:MAG: hypothetical protein H3Z50_05695 [archaeon]|nr:hypothetical protein [archaeon]MCP8306309.1 hypothetical protein [archaeon]
MQRSDLIKDKEASEILERFDKLQSNLKEINQIVKENQDKSIRAILEPITEVQRD